MNCVTRHYPFYILFVLYLPPRSTLAAGRLLAGQTVAVIGGELLLFLLWLARSTALVHSPSSNQSLAKFCCGRRMRRWWLNLDSPVSENILAMELLQWNERSRRGLVVLAVVFGLFLDPVSCFGQNLDSELTFLLPGGRSDCFFQTAVKNGTMEIEYQVTVSIVSRHKHRVSSHIHAVVF